MKKLWCYICDYCNRVTYCPTKIKGKKRELHYCSEYCIDKAKKKKTLHK